MKSSLILKLVPNPTQVLWLKRLRRRYNFVKGIRQNRTKTSEQCSPRVKTLGLSYKVPPTVY